MGGGGARECNLGDKGSGSPEQRLVTADIDPFEKLFLGCWSVKMFSIMCTVKTGLPFSFKTVSTV